MSNSMNRHLLQKRKTEVTKWTVEKLNRAEDRQVHEDPEAGAIEDCWSRDQ